ncbi:MAG TPA: mycofactocin-associated electron transfer flavoprotein alpha subunit [Ilumatobacteraceae bacterium]|jgi:electron transfer flavoprotein alpha subunit
MIAVIPIRGGTLPAGGAEAVADAAGRALLAGERPGAAAKELAGIASEVTAIELGDFAAGRWAGELAPLVQDDDLVLLPACPDGRDLAPRLAHLLHRPLLAGAIEIRRGRVSLARWGGLVIEDVPVDGPVVVTLQPGVRGVEHAHGAEPAIVELAAGSLHDAQPLHDAEVIEVLPPDVTTMDLSESTRILAGGAGLESAERFSELADLAAALGGSMGATRVITDRGWVRHERQIGTTGVVVAPKLYLAFGISGAVQHTSGLGQPDHIISVNTDPHCPMMQLADLAVVADANAVLDELRLRLGEPSDA